MTTKTIIKHLSAKRPLPLPGEVGSLAKQHLKERAERIANYLKVRKERTKCLCHACQEKQGLKRYGMDVYDSPFDKKSKEVFMCSEECMDNFYDGEGGYDYAYHECSKCNRWIVERCPSNGWYEYFRYDGEGERVCLQCHEQGLLKHGVSVESLERGNLEGMFFAWGNPELKENGWNHQGSFFIQSSESVKAYCTKALELISMGFKVITAYESMGIGGSEGHVSMFAKKG